MFRVGYKSVVILLVSIYYGMHNISTLLFIMINIPICYNPFQYRYKLKQALRMVNNNHVCLLCCVLNFNLLFCMGVKLGC